MYMKANTYNLAMDILRSPWLISEPDKMAAIARDFLHKAPVRMDVSAKKPYGISEARTGSVEEGTNTGSSKKKKCMVVPLHGTMTKYDNCTNYGTAGLAESIKRFADDSSVVGLVMDIDSGGGSSNAVPPLLEAIAYFKGTGKPIIAHCDLCCSAAYWVASQCDAIYMDNKLSEVGSIGAYYMFVDDSAPNPTTGERYITVYAEESSDKNYSYRQALEGNVKPAQEELSRLVSVFQEDVKSGRPNIKAKESGVMTGRTFVTEDAITLGMADAQRTLAETVEAVFALAGLNN